MAKRPAPTHAPQGDDRYWAAYWGEQCHMAIIAAVADPHPKTHWDLELDHAVRCAKAAWHRALSLKGVKRPS